MRANPIGWFEIYAADLKRAQAFYEKVFDGPLERMEVPGGFNGLEMLAFPADYTLCGAPGALCKMDRVEPGVGGTIVYFSCDDCAVEQARAEQAGGTVIHGKFSIGENGFISMVQDTEGNIIGLHSME